MSKRPYGPWTETQTDPLSIQRGNVVVTDDGIIVPGATYDLTPYTGLRTDTRTGFNNRKKTASPTTATRRIQTKTMEAPHYVEYKYPSYGKTRHVRNTWSVSWFTDSGYSSLPSLTTPRNRAVSGLIDKLGPAWASLIDAGEFGETAQMIKGLINMMTNVHNAHAYAMLYNAKRHIAKRGGKSGRRYDAESFARAAANINMSWNFGIMPLVQSIEDAQNAINELLGKKRKEKINFVYVDKSTSKSRSSNFTNLGQTYYRDSSVERKALVKVGVKLRADRVDRSFQDILGLNLRDVPMTLWELLPLSWLVDYITNLSGFLQLASIPRGVVERGWIVELQEARETQTTVLTGGGYPAGSFAKVNSPGVYVIENFSFTRKPFDLESFIPELELTIPSLGQAANVASLAIQKLVKPDARKIIPKSEHARVSKALQ